MAETGYHTPASASHLRPLALRYGKLEHALLIPSSLFLLASQARDALFLTLPTPSPEVPGDGEPCSETELVARFLGRLATLTADEPGSYEELLNSVITEFERSFLKGNEVHAIASTLPGDSANRQVVIQSYYAARLASGKSIKGHESALFRGVETGETKIFSVFGGQGNIEEYFDELRELVDIYDGLVTDFVEKMAEVLTALVRNPATQANHGKGLDILNWIHDASKTPDLDYLVSAPVSFPLIGVTQLAHYVVSARVLGKDPGALRDAMSGTTGHSQGIITAVCISCSDSWESFFKNAKTAVELLFWIGCRSQQAYPRTTLPPNALQDSLSAGEGTPTPMLSVRDLNQSTVEEQIKITNEHLPEERKVGIALINGPKNFVVAGPPQSLYGLNLGLRKIKADPSENHGRTPFSQRKLKFVNRFLPITAPFHSQYLKPAAEILYHDCKAIYFDQDLAIPVYATDNGENLQSMSPQQLTKRLIDMIEFLPVEWVLATRFDKPTHVIDFGPGGTSGLGGLTHRNKDGTGLRVILAGSFEVLGDEMGSKVELFDREDGAVKFSVDWVEKFSPKLVKTSMGKTYVDTPFSRLLGKPPIMVAGMTPCTISWEFVAATMNAGYHIELAGGGYYSPASMTQAVSKIQQNTTPGNGITTNIIYINPRTYTWQVELVKSLRDQGYGMDGITIGAGIPSIEVANELCQTSGLKHISFKPGSSDAIQQVINIARANPDFPIILQWTGGRAGGHHSYEDFHTPLLNHYSAIRRCGNIILLAGSGFGGADDTIPYLTGEWALAYNAPPMPFDGILLASRVMTALECKTSLAAKQAIVDAPGVEEKDWEKTYKGPAGGVITVRSELGEPIHKLATRGILLWKELDDTIFNLAKDKRIAALKAKKDYIIKKLNADFQKVWFGQNSAGEACDLEDMTYYEVAMRMIELMYVKHEKRWINLTHRNLTGDFIRRIEERFTKAEGKPSLLQNFGQLDDPEEAAEKVLSNYPECQKQLMNVQDVQHFLILCQRRGQKPVPFIPVMDDQFEVWFKKDSLWQSEDVEAVVGQDVGRVAILQGPMAVKHSTKVNQPIQEILDDIHEKHITMLTDKYYKSDADSIPVIEYFGGAASKVDDSSPVAKMKPATKSLYTFPAASSGEDLPETEKWLQLLAGPSYSWRRALLTSDIVLQGSSFQTNPLRRIFAPRFDTQFVVDETDGIKNSTVTVFDRRHGKYVPAAKASFVGHNGIEVVMYEDRTATHKLLGLTLQFTYHPDIGYAPIREVMDGRNDRIKAFYWQLWFGEDLPTDLDNAPVDAMTFDGGRVTIEGKAIEDFCRVIGNESEAYVKLGDKKRQAPMDFAIVVGWKAVIKAIFPKAIDGDLLKLVHLSNGFRLLPGCSPLCEGDEVETSAQINAVTNSPSGKTVEVEGTITRHGKPVMQVLTRFLYRGSFTDFQNTFKRSHETPMQMHLKTQKDVEILLSKEWFQPFNPEQQLLGTTLTFRLSSLLRFKSHDLLSHVSTSGTVLLELPTKEIIQIASVEYEAGESFGNPVVDYLSRHGSPIEQPVSFANGGYSVIQISDSVYSSVSATPPSNSPYAEISSDYNPIHVSPTFSAYVELPGSTGITHGMFTSASTRKFVETFAAENVPSRVISYEVTFLDMVLPNTSLKTKLSHVGMVNGKKIIKVETFNQETGNKVLEGTAEVEQPISAYMFTGQGSQEQGMGMDLYESSAVAKDVWDRADRHFLENYGFSIINIVKNNPKELTVHFGGPRGQKIKKNYTSMVYEVVDDDGKNVSMPIFKDIKESSTFYTFISPTGLLSATQFTQPALTLMEKAAFDDMKSKGLVQQGAPFGGHSLGEYSALAAIANVIPIESLVDVVFYRGMTMQVAVPRDSLGRSEYAMMAVNPSRIGKTFNETALRYVVDHVATQTSWLVEIVNYNVENQQYIAAGSLHGLDTLSNVFNVLKVQKIELDKLMQTMSVESLKEKLSEIVEMCKEKSLEKAKAAGGRLELERGFATIPLKGIDVPFHSSFLRNGVKPFRSFLARKIPKTQINPALLSSYIPNVTAKPFSISKEYITECWKLTGSPKLKGILDNWDSLSTSGIKP
ncbi:putative Fatty acid synthase beta subunit [Taphrina deformans PYCC 5710]|uniref:Fatty acid synthase beta subunit n=1 Tax=Taphrina deformans (strain PYCC 5710 / ATCC 11124 / CBS 356.35 / IMI 108563 / JCM 9778 / NBRC 8474) TaxID=1097556 RepID=R4XIR6_TAPDE|nr:putative Fatty acid synthase beta subunit [Taphrina deformans PYCC 5710]|eukprot:CCG83263.1 putative Fatty acid synthase beta subunit [Taphrina deformans PYCC 5710]